MKVGLAAALELQPEPEEVRHETVAWSYRNLVLERDLRSQTLQVTPNGRDSKPFVVSPIGDRAVVRGGITVDLQPIPMFRMTDIIIAKPTITDRQIG